MELGGLQFGEITEITEYEDGTSIKRTQVMHDYQKRRDIRAYTKKTKVKTYADVELEIKSIIEDARAKKCLDFTIQVILDPLTGLPKRLITERVDPRSKLS